MDSVTSEYLLQSCPFPLKHKSCRTQVHPRLVHQETVGRRDSPTARHTYCLLSQTLVWGPAAEGIGAQDPRRWGRAYLALFPAQAMDAGGQLHSAECLRVVGW